MTLDQTKGRSGPTPQPVHISVTAQRIAANYRQPMKRAEAEGDRATEITLALSLQWESCGAIAEAAAIGRPEDFERMAAGDEAARARVAASAAEALEVLIRNATTIAAEYGLTPDQTADLVAAGREGFMSRLGRIFTHFTQVGRA